MWQLSDYVKKNQNKAVQMLYVKIAMDSIFLFSFACVHCLKIEFRVPKWEENENWKSIAISIEFANGMCE